MDWFSKLAREWPVISGAPVSFVTAVLIVIGVVWLIINWSYSSVLSSKNAQIELLTGRLAAYEDKLKGATPQQAADELSRLRREVEALKNPPRDDGSIYQKGHQIGVVADVRIDSAQRLVTFGRLTVNGVLDEASNAEFRNLVLAFRGSDGVGQLSFGLAGTTTYENARFEIVGNRGD